MQTVMTQCELWTDNSDMNVADFSAKETKSYAYEPQHYMVAEKMASYGVDNE